MNTAIGLAALAACWPLLQHPDQPAVASAHPTAAQQHQQQQQQVLFSAPSNDDSSVNVIDELSVHGRPLSGRFLHVTDIHLDLLYRTGAPPSSQCHIVGKDKGKGGKKNHLEIESKRPMQSAGFYGSPGAGCDSPPTLVNETFRFIKEVLVDADAGLDFVVWTGDNARHDSSASPRSEEEVRQLNRILTQQMVDALTVHPTKSGRPRIPVLASIGNNDVHPHNRLKYSAKSRNPTLNFFADLWAPFIPPSQDIVFRRIGSYVVDLVPGKLWGVSLNTMYLTSLNDAVPDCRRRRVKPPKKTKKTKKTKHSKKSKHSKHQRDLQTDADNGEEGASTDDVEEDDNDDMSILRLTAGDDVLSWLETSVLIPARNRNIGVYISGHIPPNVVNYGTGCYTEFSRLSVKYRDVIQGQFYGHMNIDHFFFTTPDQVLRRNSVSASSTVAPMSLAADYGDNALETAIGLDSDGAKNDASDQQPAPASIFRRDEGDDDQLMHIMAPTWVFLYFEYLILHFKVITDTDDLPNPVLIAPSVVPAFNPALRVFKYDTLQPSSRQPQRQQPRFKKGSNRKANPPRTPQFGRLLDYDQFYADLDYWNNHQGPSASVAGKPRIPSSGKYLFELEYSPRRAYNMSGDALDADSMLEFGQRLAGRFFEIPKSKRDVSSLDSTADLKPTDEARYEGEDEGDDDDDNNGKEADKGETEGSATDQPSDHNNSSSSNSTRRKKKAAKKERERVRRRHERETKRLRHEFFTNMVVHMAGIQSPASSLPWQ
ncbi:hypothetical protein BC831DRAFT_415076 [Entophlyctis helioformis]|nr:hypothetical protein BC831DRAFT_415076 [Entophlyctis helioformis]